MARKPVTTSDGTVVSPTEDNCLICPDKEPDAKKSYKSGVPEAIGSTGDKLVHGTVEAVGPGRRHAETGMRQPMSVKPGDRVMHSRYAGSRVEVNGETYHLVPEGSIQATMSGGKKS